LPAAIALAEHLGIGCEKSVRNCVIWFCRAQLFVSTADSRDFFSENLRGWARRLCESFYRDDEQSRRRGIVTKRNAVL
jgi:hypothetical protein